VADRRVRPARLVLHTGPQSWQSYRL
jgi:hypothetical protein